MFEWLRRKMTPQGSPIQEKILHQVEDSMEQSLWEIKEEFDLPTEEIVNVVQSKRKNFDYIHQVLEKKQK
mgnify:CR=1 FL=1|tara:strand:+ start:796 stop:1005 length:210 start_codon:yes stop_codon:yes gene_type:complete